MDYTTKIIQIRTKNNQFYKNSGDSPLLEEQKQSFTEMNYFEVNKKYKIEVELKIFDNIEEVSIFGTKGDERTYLRYGYIDFTIDNTKCKLTVFKHPEAEDYLFVPFRDATTGKETYGAGRYLELEKISDNNYIADFNLAYNPYCAYNDRYSCALPPSENFLSIAIPAGQKKFHD